MTETDDATAQPPRAPGLRDERPLSADEVVNAWLTHLAEILGKPVDQWPKDLRDELTFALTSREGLMFVAGYRKGLAGAEGRGARLRAALEGGARMTAPAPRDERYLSTEAMQAIRNRFAAALNNWGMEEVLEVLDLLIAERNGRFAALDRMIEEFARYQAALARATGEEVDRG